MPASKAYIIIISFSLLILNAYFLLFRYISFPDDDFDKYIKAIFEVDSSFIILYIVALLLLFAVHEFIHIICFLLVGKARIKDIEYGIDWKKMTLYAHSKIPLKINSFRIVAIMPGLILGLTPLIFGFILKNYYLGFLGAIHLSGSLGDLLIIWMLRKYNSSLYILDCKEKIGCIVLQNLD